MKRILIGLVVLIVLVAVWAAMPGRAPTSAQTSEPAITRASELRLDRGYMLWRQDTDTIYVFFDPPFGQCEGGTVETYPDNWDEATMPENDPNIVAPAGQSQPNRGFGYVWRNNPTVRERLGWTSFPELAYTLLVYTNGSKTWFASPNGIFVVTGNQWRRINLWATDPCLALTPPQQQNQQTQPTQQPTATTDPAATQETTAP